jgi:hypothetical protein
MTQAARAFAGDAGSATDLSLEPRSERRREIQLDALDFPEQTIKNGKSQ